jgi:RNA polymerase sigma-70 factor (ECF subfamily)
MEQESAKDLVQELFVDLWDKRKQIHIMETLEGYLKAAVRNRIYNHIRSMGIKKRHYQTISQESKESGVSTEELNNERELRKLYQEEIGKLPPKMKEIFTLNKEKGFSISQIAEQLSLSEQTIKNQLGNALKKIRSGLEHYRLLWLWLFFSLTVFLN